MTSRKQDPEQWIARAVVYILQAQGNLPPRSRRQLGTWLADKRDELDKLISQTIETCHFTFTVDSHEVLHAVIEQLKVGGAPTAQLLLSSRARVTISRWANLLGVDATAVLQQFANAHGYLQVHPDDAGSILYSDHGTAFVWTRRLLQGVQTIVVMSPGEDVEDVIKSLES